MTSPRRRVAITGVGLVTPVGNDVETTWNALLEGRSGGAPISLFDATGFWDAIAAEPFVRGEWLEAVRTAPLVKEGFYTVLSSRDVLPEVERALTRDPRLCRCFQ